MSDSKSRSDLKEKFKKGKTPSEEDFQDLINASFNQKDDRVRRPANTPLVIDAEANGEVVQLKIGDKTFTLKLDTEGNLELKDHNVVVPGTLHVGYLTLAQNKISIARLADLELEAGKGKKLRTNSNARLNGLDIYTTQDKIALEGWQELDVQLIANAQKRLVLGPLPQAKDLVGPVCADTIAVNQLDAAQQIEAPTVSATKKVTGPLVEGTTKVTAPLIEGKQIKALEKVVGPVVLGEKEVTAPVVNATSKVAAPTAEITGKISGKNIDASSKIMESGSALVPKGVIVMWSGAKNNIPKGWALCDGANSTPDLRDRFIVGAGNEYTVNTKGGEKNVTLNNDQIPSHRHKHHFTRILAILSQSNDSVTGNRQYGMMETHPRKEITDSTGGGKAHENRPPYFALCFIMKL